MSVRQMHMRAVEMRPMGMRQMAVQGVHGKCVVGVEHVEPQQFTAHRADAPDGPHEPTVHHDAGDHYSHQVDRRTQHPRTGSGSGHGDQAFPIVDFWGSGGLPPGGGF